MVRITSENILLSTQANSFDRGQSPEKTIKNVVLEIAKNALKDSGPITWWGGQIDEPTPECRIFHSLAELRNKDAFDDMDQTASTEAEDIALAYIVIAEDNLSDAEKSQYTEQPIISESREYINLTEEGLAVLILLADLTGLEIDANQRTYKMPVATHRALEDSSNDLHMQGLN
jgi:hypothetical protein